VERLTRLGFKISLLISEIFRKRIGKPKNDTKVSNLTAGIAPADLGIYLITLQRVSLVLCLQKN
jgi:hypothetical protein